MARIRAKNRKQQRRRKQKLAHATPNGSEAHRRAQRWHAMARARERYNAELTQTQYEELCKQVASRRDTLILRRQQRDNKEVCGVRFGDACYVLVYDPATGAICTFLPPENYGLFVG